MGLAIRSRLPQEDNIEATPFALMSLYPWPPRHPSDLFTSMPFNNLPSFEPPFHPHQLLHIVFNVSLGIRLRTTATIYHVVSEGVCGNVNSVWVANSPFTVLPVEMGASGPGARYMGPAKMDLSRFQRGLISRRRLCPLSVDGRGEGNGHFYLFVCSSVAPCWNFEMCNGLMVVSWGVSRWCGNL